MKGKTISAGEILEKGGCLYSSIDVAMITVEMGLDPTRPELTFDPQ